MESFATAARDVDVPVSLVDAGSFTDELAAVVEAPAYGTPLPFDGVSYADTPIRMDPTGADLFDAATGVTHGVLAIADYGSVLLAETGHGEELLALYPDRHVVVVAASDVVDDMPTAVDRIDEQAQTRPADYIIATGPSATADMGAVVTGVHGPRNVHVVVLEDR